MYASVDVDITSKTEEFRIEAERLLEIEMIAPNGITMVSAMFMSMGYLAQGKDHATIRHMSQAIRIGRGMSLFGVSKEVGQAAFDKMNHYEKQSVVFPTWGVFNWFVCVDQAPSSRDDLY